jgi:hypothetical protein
LFLFICLLLFLVLVCFIGSLMMYVKGQLKSCFRSYMQDICEWRRYRRRNYWSKHQLLKQRPITYTYTYTYSLVSNIIVINHIFIGTKAFCNFGCVVLNSVLDIINFFFADFVCITLNFVWEIIRFIKI